MSSLRKCKKINCTEFAEYRKQFCITHRRKLKPNTNLESKIDDNSFERSNLINEQNIDYEESLRVDMENRYQKDIEEALKISLKIERIEQVEKKKKEIELLDSLIDENNFISLKFKLPNSILLTKKFYIDVKFKDLRNFLDCYILENKIVLENYIIVSNFPKKIYDIESNSILLKDEYKEKNIVFYVSEI